MVTATVLCRCQKLLTSFQNAPTKWFSHPVIYLPFEIEHTSRQFDVGHTFDFRLITCTDKFRVFYLHLQCCKSTLYIRHICEDAYHHLRYPPPMHQSSNERCNFPHSRLHSHCHSCCPQPPFLP